MNQIKEFELSEYSFNEGQFPSNYHFCTSYNESIFNKKLEEIKNKYSQNNNNEDKTINYSQNESNGSPTKGLFSPKSTRMFKNYTIKDKIRIKWLRSIRNYIKLQEMQVVFKYLKSANVKLLIRGLLLRKCLTLWHLKYLENQRRNKWIELVKKEKREILISNAKKVKRTKEKLAKINFNKSKNESKNEIKQNENEFENENEKEEVFLEKEVKPFLEDNEQIDKNYLNDKIEGPSKSSSHHHHRRRHRHHRQKEYRSYDEDELIKSREVEVEEFNEKKPISKDVMEKRLSEIEKCQREQEANYKKLLKLFVIFAIALGFLVFVAGIIVGKSIKSNEKLLNAFVNSQSKITQDISAEVADFRVALTNMANKINSKGKH